MQCIVYTVKEKMLPLSWTAPQKNNIYSTFMSVQLVKFY